MVSLSLPSLHYCAALRIGNWGVYNALRHQFVTLNFVFKNALRGWIQYCRLVAYFACLKGMGLKVLPRKMGLVCNALRFQQLGVGSAYTCKEMKWMGLLRYMKTNTRIHFPPSYLTQMPYSISDTFQNRSFGSLDLYQRPPAANRRTRPRAPINRF